MMNKHEDIILYEGIEGPSSHLNYITRQQEKIIDIPESELKVFCYLFVHYSVILLCAQCGHCLCEMA